MTETFSEELLNILLNIPESIKSVPFWKDYSFWLSLGSTAALVVTLIVLIKYTCATKKMADATESMAKYQLIPAVDVNMIFDRNIKKTYFWFSNDSSLPGIVYLEFKKNKEDRKKVYQPLRIPPKSKMKTATTFEFSPTASDKIVIYILVKPALEKSNIKFEFEKSYTFIQNQWNENSWNYPDPQFRPKKLAT